MELTRIIHPIGQGGFYSEKLVDDGKEINVIYDCGGNSQKSMESYLENYYPVYDKTEKKQKTIDAVFISHLHEDHINGLKYLLEHSNIRKLILPQLTEDEKYETFLYNLFKNPNSLGNTFLLELYVQNNEIYRNIDTQIIIIPKAENSDLSIEEVIDDNTDYSIYSIPSSFHLGCMIHFNKKWVFIPYNPPVNNKLLVKNGCSFKEHFMKEFKLSSLSISELPRIVKHYGTDFCKNVYTKYFGYNHNAYSMSLFSGSIKINRTMPRRFRYDYNCHFGNYQGFFCSPNCLYMGDFDTKNHFNSLQKFYLPFWDSIASLQVPHHGSRHNHDPRLYEKSVKRGFISVGESNRYHHPNVDTLIGIQELGCEPVLVTEKINTMKIFHAIK